MNKKTSFYTNLLPTNINDSSNQIDQTKPAGNCYKYESLKEPLTSPENVSDLFVKDFLDKK